MYHTLVIIKHVNTGLFYVETEDFFMILEIPSNKLAVVSCAYLLISFFKNVSKPNAIKKCNKRL
jgi:hypothetical protein